MKRLITDRDILTGAVSGRIVLDENTLITPSARDRAAKLGLEVVEAGAGWHAIAPTAAAASCSRCGSAGCGGGCASCGTGVALQATGGHAAELGALADGLYLVRVAGGKAASVLPATGPGLLRRAGG